MSPEVRDPGPPLGPRESIERRQWPRERQLRVLGMGVASIIVLVLGIWLSGRFFGRHEAPAAAPPQPAGTFRPTAQQMKTFTIETVGLHGFVSEELTEGKIAINADRATPLFSPYSGRVIRVIAALGDSVKQGAPLAQIEAIGIRSGAK